MLGFTRAGVSEYLISMTTGVGSGVGESGSICEGVMKEFPRINMRIAPKKTSIKVIADRRNVLIRI